MHDGLRVNGRDDVLGCHIEQQVSLDEFQTLVDQGRGVDRDDGPHLPRGMRQRLLCAHTAQLLAPPTPEWASRSSEDEVRDLGPARDHRRGQTAFMHARGQCLGDRGVLGIHRNNLAGKTHRVLYQRTANDQRLLIR